MRNYEVTFIVDPVLSSDEIEATAKAYEKFISDEDYKIVHIDKMGLKQLAYPINRRSSGVYFCIEFSGDKGILIPKMELALRRDERIMRFLTVSLDKYGVKYNEDKRAGKIGSMKDRKKKEEPKSEKTFSKSAYKVKKPAAKPAEAPATEKASSEKE